MKSNPIIILVIGFTINLIYSISQARHGEDGGYPGGSGEGGQGGEEGPRVSGEGERKSPIFTFLLYEYYVSRSL